MMSRNSYATRTRLKRVLQILLLLLAIVVLWIGFHHITLEPIPFSDDVFLRMYPFEVRLLLGKPQKVSESDVAPEMSYTFYRGSSTCTETICCTFSDGFPAEKLTDVTVISVYPSDAPAKEAFLTYSTAIRSEYQEDEDFYCTTERKDGCERLSTGAKGDGVGLHYSLVLCGRELHMSCTDFH